MYKKMLVPLDGSELAENALKHVEILISTQIVKEVIFIRVVDTAAEPLYNLEISIKERIEREIKDYLDSVNDTFRVLGVSTQSVMLYGNVADTILNYAEQNDIEIIVMSTHGRSDISRFFAGSIAEKIIRYSIIPVLIVPSTGAKNTD